MALVATVLAMRGTEPSQPPSPGSTSPSQSIEPASASTGGPRVSFEQVSFDFGKVPYQRTVEAVYRFKNVGDAPLKVADVSVNVVEGC